MVLARLLNQIILVLSFAGMFVAGVLSMGHLMNVQLPCGTGGGCTRVALDPSSFLFGTHWLAVAYVGVLGYAVLAMLAIVRTMLGTESHKWLVAAGFFLSLVGAAESVYLQYFSVAVIHAICEWCLTSAILMVLILVAHLIMIQRDEPMPASSTISDSVLPWGLFVFLALSLGGEYLVLKHEQNMPLLAEDVVRRTPVALLIRPESHSLGPADAKVTVVEFYDLMCPLCRSSYTDIQNLVTNSGKIRWVLRDFPLYKNPEHKNALAGAIVAECMADQGQFWQYVDAVYKQEPHSFEDVEAFYALAAGMGADEATLKKRVQDEKDPAFQRVYADLTDGIEIGVNSTPTIVVISPGLPNKAVTPSTIRNTLSSPPYAALDGLSDKAAQ